MSNLTIDERILALESDIKNTPRSGELHDLIRDLIFSEEFIEELAERIATKLEE